MYCFSSNIPGTQQFFSSKVGQALNFLRDVRISTNDKEMFNVFLTFSLADYDERALHEKFPKEYTKHYLDKIVVKNIDSIPEGADPSDYITTKEDWTWRDKAIRENTDICNAYFDKKISLLFKHILKPIFGAKDYICRFEFQNRGTIHCHMIIICEKGPSCTDMFMANTPLPKVKTIDENGDEIETNEIDEKHPLFEKINEARNKMAYFNSYTIGVSAIHPEKDPVNWPAPHGLNVFKPAVNVTRQDFTEFADDPIRIYEHFTKQLNRFGLHKCKVGYCCDPKNVKWTTTIDKNGKEIKEQIIPCRHDFPFPVTGFDVEINKENKKPEKITPKLDEDGNLDIDGSYHDGKTVVLLRNHPDMVKLIPEIMVIWGSNIDNKVVTSYPQLINYLLKYILKGEKQSDFFTNVAKRIISKIEEDCPIKKAFSKILLNSVNQRDMSLNEIMLINSDLDYVKMSRTSRTVDLRGSKTFKKGKKDESVNILPEDLNANKADNSNWAEAYNTRESCKKYIELCEGHPANKHLTLGKHPKDISLREFVKNFTMKWGTKGKPDNIFPNFLPPFRYVVNKGRKNYEEYCKNLLLQDKPGCYLDSVGKGQFKSCEDELRDFVENSEFCPQTVKDDFKESQKDINPKNDSEKTYAAEDVPEELYVENNCEPANAEPEPWFDLHNLFGDKPQNDKNLDENEVDIDDENYDMTEDQNDPHQGYDWSSDRKELGLTTSQIKEAGGWLEHQKTISKLVEKEQRPPNPETLNERQRAGYDYVVNWMEQKVSNPETEPILLNVSGEAGCGKTYMLNCIQQTAIALGGKTFLMKAAPTGKAAFLIQGDTIHGLLSIQPCIPKSKPVLKCPNLREEQERFKNTEIIFYDEKSMISLWMLYAIDQRLRELKPLRNKMPFGGVSIVIMGDFGQLPPVLAQPLYYTKTTGLTHYQTLGKALFQLFERTLILDENMRQKGHDQLIGSFKRLRNGTFNVEDYKVFAKRELNSDNFTLEERKDFIDNGLLGCAKNKDLVEYNKHRLKLLNQPIAKIKSQNKPKSVASLSSESAKGLPSTIWLCKGAKGKLLYNSWRPAGIVKGADCYVRYIIYEGNSKPPELPSLVIVYVPDYIGENGYLGMDKCIPIVPKKETWIDKSMGSDGNCFRISIPIKLNWGMTIHAFQGISAPGKLMLNLSNQEFACGSSYVGVTRTTSLENLAFVKVHPFKRWTSIFKNPIFKMRLEQDKKEQESNDRYFPKKK